MAAYIRLASRSQAKLQNNRNWFTCLAQPHLRRARHPPICHFNFRLAHVRRWIWHALSQWPSQAFQSLMRSWFVAAYLARQLVAGVVAFDVILALNSTLLWLVWTVTHFWQQGKMVSHDRSSSMEPQLKFPGCSHFRRRSDNHYRCQQCRLNDGLTLCTQDSPCEVCKDWLPEAWQALERATRQKQKCKAAAAAKKSHDMDYSIEIHAPEGGLPPIKQREDESSWHKDLAKRAKTATSSTSKALEAKSTDRPSRSRDRNQRQFHPVFLWWEDLLGRTAAMGLPGPKDLNAIDRTVVNGVAEIVVTGLRDIMTHPGLVIHLGDVRVGSGPGPCLRREGPAPDPSRLTRRTFRGLTVLWGGWQMSDLLPLIITRGHRFIMVPVLFISGIGWS